MSKRSVNLTNPKIRSILTDMLPFEVPPTFSNRGFYRFLRDNSVEIADKELRWIGDTDRLDSTMIFLFGCKSGTNVDTRTVTAWGKERKIRFLKMRECRMDTMPFNFRISHKIEGRSLSVVHPRNQIAVANFYASHSSLIIFHTSKSDFSIRFPVSVAKYVFYKDDLHYLSVDRQVGGIEQDDREYEQLGSYFVYKSYRNIHRFFESYKYHRCEKKYDSMVQMDVSKCFDSIYTHSLPWAVIGKSQIKHWLEASKSTFAGRFDELMQHLNHKETNGIVIGPEFSRIFAEIILQSVDMELQERLADIDLIHKIHYEIFRYVDDYFIFFNEPSTQLLIFENLQKVLKDKKLTVNADKIKLYEKPIITEITIAKERVSSMFDEALSFAVECVGATEVERRLVGGVDANRLIVRYKSMVKETGVNYGDILNYTFAILESKLSKLLEKFASSDPIVSNYKILISNLLGIVEFSFFIYSASPKVNHTIRLCRLISKSIEFLRKKRVPKELTSPFFKYVHDNIMQQMEKNSVNFYREIETLYLLIALSEVGRDYWLPEATLMKYFSIQDGGVKIGYFRKGFMNYFSITVLLSYMKHKIRYLNLRNFIEWHIIEKLEFMKANCSIDTESTILFLDLICCPYISNSCKELMADILGVDNVGLLALRGASAQWFTAWGKDFEFRKELDAKRSLEVY